MAHFSERCYLPPEEREVFRKLKEETQSMDFVIKSGEKVVKLHKIMLKLRSVGNEAFWSRSYEVGVAQEFENCLEEFLSVLYLGHPPRFYVAIIKKLWIQMDLATWDHVFKWFHQCKFRKDFGRIDEAAGYAYWVDELNAGKTNAVRSRMASVPKKERLLPPQIEPEVAAGFFAPYKISKERRELAVDNVDEYDEATSDPMSEEEYRSEVDALSENVNWAKAMCDHMFMQKGRWVVPHQALDPLRLVDKVMVFDHTLPRGCEEMALFSAGGRWTETLRSQWNTAIIIDNDKEREWRMMAIRGYPVHIRQVHREIADRAQVVHDRDPYRSLYSTSRLPGLRYSYASPAFLDALPAGCFDFLPQLCRVCGEVKHLGAYCDRKCRKAEKKIKSKAMIRVQEWIDERVPFFQYHGVYSKECPRYAKDDPLYGIITEEDPERAPMSAEYYERIRKWLSKEWCDSLSEYYEQRYWNLGSRNPDPRYLEAMKEVDNLIFDRSKNEMLLQRLQRLDEARVALAVEEGQQPQDNNVPAGGDEGPNAINTQATPGSSQKTQAQRGGGKHAMEQAGEHVGPLVGTSMRTQEEAHEEGNVTDVGNLDSQDYPSLALRGIVDNFFNDLAEAAQRPPPAAEDDINFESDKDIDPYSEDSKSSDEHE